MKNLGDLEIDPVARFVHGKMKPLNQCPAVAACEQPQVLQLLEAIGDLSKTLVECEHGLVNADAGLAFFRRLRAIRLSSHGWG